MTSACVPQASAQACAPTCARLPPSSFTDDLQVEEGHDYCVVHPPAALKPGVVIDTYDRMAMAFSLAACGAVQITIDDPGCTRKTFPTYFQVLDSIVQR
jgi:5-enolpyruvylshikimate-3-phosphate synthase